MSGGSPVAEERKGSKGRRWEDKERGGIEVERNQLSRTSGVGRVVYMY